MNRKRNFESHPPQSHLIKRKIEESGLNAHSGVVTDYQMKKTELELAQDGIYFWHYLFTYFGLDMNTRPNEKEKMLEYKSDGSQSLTNSDLSQQKAISIQPSVEDHQRLFQILKFNFSPHANIPSIFSINKTREDLDKRVDEVIKNKNKDKLMFESFCNEVERYLWSIKDNINQATSGIPFDDDNKNKLAEIMTMLKTNPKEKANKGLPKLFDQHIGRSFQLMCQILISIVEIGLLKSISVNTKFLEELFSKDSFLKEENVQNENLEYLVKKYSQLTPTLRPQNGVKNLKIYKSNVVTANLYIKYKHGEKSDQYQYTEINHHDKSAFSRSSFLDSQKDEFDDHIQQHYSKNRKGEKNGKDVDLAKCTERAVHDSEKALMMSLFRYKQIDEKEKDDKLDEERKEGDQPERSDKIDRIKNIAERLSSKLQENGVGREDSLTIQEIGLQFFSIREYCYWCESYLSHEFKEIYDDIKKHLHYYFPKISISPEVSEESILMKYGSYSFVITNEQIASNEDKKNKFVIDRTNMKSYFSKQFLIDVLKSSDIMFERCRSYFLNDPKNFEPEEAEGYIKEVSLIADKLNKKPKNIKPKIEPNKYLDK